MRLFVYDMLVNVNVIYYVHVCEQARWARSAGNSAIENLCIIIIIIINSLHHIVKYFFIPFKGKRECRTGIRTKQKQYLHVWKIHSLTARCQRTGKVETTSII